MIRRRLFLFFLWLKERKTARGIYNSVSLPRVALIFIIF